MTECENAEIRDLLPDFANGVLSLAQAERVRTHVNDCAACAEELEIVRAMRAMPIRPVSLNLPAIVAALPRASGIDSETDTTVISLDERRRVAAKSASRAPRSGVWRMAAAIGVMVIGGWSVFLVRSGGLTMAMNGRADSLSLSDTPFAMVSSGAAVSYGGVSDLTDEELQRVLDRLDKWDGATSTETTASTAPILPVKAGGLE